MYIRSKHVFARPHTDRSAWSIRPMRLQTSITSLWKAIGSLMNGRQNEIIQGIFGLFAEMRLDSRSQRHERDRGAAHTERLAQQMLSGR